MGCASRARRIWELGDIRCMRVVLRLQLDASEDV